MPRLRLDWVSIDLPDDWQDATQLMALGPARKGFRANLVMSRQPLQAGASFDRWVTETIEGLRAQQGTTVQTSAEATLGDLTGWLIESTTVIQGKKVAQVHFLVAEDRVGHVMVYSDLADHIAQARPIALSLLSRVNFDPHDRSASDF